MKERKRERVCLCTHVKVRIDLLARPFVNKNKEISLNMFLFRELFISTNFTVPYLCVFFV